MIRIQNMKSKISPIILFVTILFLSLTSINVSALGDNDVTDTDNPAQQVRKKIAVVNFLPLPMSRLSNRHDRVFTGEIYFDSYEKFPDKSNCYFIPENYLNIIQSTFRSVAQMNSVELHLVSNIGESLEISPDFIIFGSVIEAKVANDYGEIKLNINLLDGKTYRTLDKKLIHKIIEKKETPFSLESSIHTIGTHGNNFHPQRVLFNSTAYACAVDILQMISQAAQ